MSANDPIAQQRERVEQARAELVRSVDALSGRAISTRNELRAKAVRIAVPAAGAVVALVVARAVLKRRRR
jgi:hypothetical protein